MEATPNAGGRYELVVRDSPEALALRCAEVLATAIDLRLEEHPRCSVALAGGTTPAAAYRLLGREHLSWERVDLLLGDERWVAADDPASNARMLRETLLAYGTPGAQACLHPVPTQLANPEAGAEAYAASLAQLCPGTPPVLDLVLLGLGEDGHTASLFPGTAATRVRDRWTCIGEGKGLPRISLTAPVLSAARQVVLLVSGAGKRQALERLLDPAEPAERTPARLVQPARPVLVLADNAAAGR